MLHLVKFSAHSPFEQRYGFWGSVHPSKPSQSSYFSLQIAALVTGSILHKAGLFGVQTKSIEMI